MPLTPELWEGDGITDDPDELQYAIEDLGLLPVEIRAIEECCKREAWVHEKTAKYENREDNLILSRYFWRRAQRFKEIAEQEEKST
jgi:hypothetical protein